MVEILFCLCFSMQDFSQGELTLQTGPVHHQVNDETRRREQILDVKRSLAQAVMLRSKEDAGQLTTNASYKIFHLVNITFKILFKQRDSKWK